MKLLYEQVAVIYMLTRLYINVSQTFYPFYVEQVQQLPKIYVSLMPMTVYFTSFLCSNVTSTTFVSQRISRKVHFHVNKTK